MKLLKISVFILGMETGLPLEDDINDIISKALQAYRLRDKLPTDPKDLRQFVKNKLFLDPDALFNIPDYHPVTSFPEGLIQHTFDFYPTSLNIWTLEYDDGSIIVDAGYNRNHMEAVMTLSGHSLQNPPQAILITHWHQDHIGGLLACPYCPIICGRTENISHNPDPVIKFNIASKPWTIFRLPGHSEDSLGFYTEYKGEKLLFCGDALFAGSLGRLHESANPHESLDILLNALRSLDDDTLLLPGHGPATTIGQEWENNPFLKGRR